MSQDRLIWSARGKLEVWRGDAPVSRLTPQEGGAVAVETWDGQVWRQGPVRPATQEEAQALAEVQDAVDPRLHRRQDRPPERIDLRADLARVLATVRARPDAEGAIREMIRRGDWAGLAGVLPSDPPRKPLTDEEERAARREAALARAARAKVPAGIVAVLRGDFGPVDRERAAMAMIFRWQAKKPAPPPALLLSGPNQCGKTIAAAAWLLTQEWGRWTSAADLALAARPDPDGLGALELRALREASAIVVDGAGEVESTAAWEQIGALIVHTLARGARIVVTTDLAPADFFSRFGDGERNRVLARWRLHGESREVT